MAIVLMDVHAIFGNSANRNRQGETRIGKRKRAHSERRRKAIPYLENGTAAPARWLRRASVSEQQLPLRPLKRRPGLIAQVIHTAEELAVHHDGEIASDGRQRQLVA